MTPGGSAAWRSQSQVPFDRLSTPAFEGGRRGRQSEVNSDNAQDLSAQDLWLASQGDNLGNVGTLGLGFPDAFDGPGNRGRDTAARGLETPGNFAASRRGPSHFDHDKPGPGTMSAPLSPHRLYAQLEMGKGPAAGWPTYDPRQNVTGGSSVSSGGPSAYAGSSTGGRGNIPNRSTASSHAAPGSGAPTPRSGSINASNSKSQESAGLGPVNMSMPMFQPFSPPMPQSSLRHMNEAEANSASFISPSTLLSPQPAPATLPPPHGPVGVDSLANEFGRMGVAPPGHGVENDKKAKGKLPGWAAVPGPASGPGSRSGSVAGSKHTSPNPSRRPS